MQTITLLTELKDKLGEALNNNKLHLAEKLIVELIAASDRIDSEVALKNYVG